ncbi:hypothetical protein [Rhodoferax sp.]|uniref:hypothetical protein n=1 Tax=Rhodoferax sp. TaxID=50421 RepID=UPI002ACEDBA1|nr:hypothetical protein [Rhodoferax sp.]MDZ7919853.1 hypothetical protein [Rhodoferax sp.]
MKLKLILNALLGLSPQATPADDSHYVCVIKKKQHYCADDPTLIDGPNDTLPGMPGTQFTVNRRTGEIAGSKSPFGTFSKPTFMETASSDKIYFVYYAEPIDGIVPVLHVNIFPNVSTSTKPLTVLLGRFVFEGECE